jgi:hypothetical protein
VCPYCEVPPIVIAEPEAPLTDLPPQDAILFDQIGERYPLSVIEPVMARSSNRRTDTSITNRSLYHERAKNGRNPVDLSWDITSWFFEMFGKKLFTDCSRRASDTALCYRDQCFANISWTSFLSAAWLSARL